jgi:hypothetical protein
MFVGFAGETHGCYSDALQMALGREGPGESVLEVLTGSPFGMSLYDDGRPFFASRMWKPETGIDAAMDLLGWTCDRIGGSRDAAIEHITRASPEAPILAGPVEMGLLPHHPGLSGPIGADHYLTLLGREGDNVILHDPRAHPYTALPIDALLKAWQTETLMYHDLEPYSFRTGFRRVREVDVPTALRDMLPAAVQYLEGKSAADCTEAADLLEEGLNMFQYFHLADFMVCAASRRRLDAAVLLERIGCHGPARILDQQARLIGSMQYPLVTEDNAAAAAALRKLAPTFDQLRLELLEAIAEDG